jgi:hypothetical protein
MRISSGAAGGYACKHTLESTSGSRRIVSPQRLLQLADNFGISGAAANGPVLQLRHPVQCRPNRMANVWCVAWQFQE